MNIFHNINDTINIDCSTWNNLLFQSLLRTGSENTMSTVFADFIRKIYEFPKQKVPRGTFHRFRSDSLIDIAFF